MFPDFSFANQKIVILGLARQGIALARFFCDAGATVTISDRATETDLADELAQLAGLPVDFVLGDHPLSLLDECDVLCLSGGVPPQIEIVQEAIRRGIPLTNDVLLTMQLAQARGLGPVVAITGSSGKTTTTTLVGKMLSAMGHPVHVGGNIGVPLIDRIGTIRVGEFIVLELSSFQLELFNATLAWNPLNGASGADGLGVRLDVAALLNITPNHLDRHADMVDYANAKLNLVRHLADQSSLIVNADDPVVSRLTETLHTDDAPPSEWKLTQLLDGVRANLAPQNVIPFSRKRDCPTGAAFADNTLMLQGRAICERSALRLRGDHNVSNALASAAISRAAISSAAHNKLTAANRAATEKNVEKELEQTVSAMAQVMQTFAGVAHRLEVVADERNVQWINDSIATSPERTLAGLRSFEAGEQRLILLIGGKDKNLSWERLASEVNQRADHLIGFGEAGAPFVQLVQEQAKFARIKAPSTAVVSSLEQAIKLAGQLAKSACREPKTPTVVLLSPGGTSYDAYKDFEARGEHFRQLVGKQVAGQETV